MFFWLPRLVTIYLFWIFSTGNLFVPGYTKETFLGLILKIPLAYFGSRIRMKLPPNDGNKQHLPSLGLFRIFFCAVICDALFSLIPQAKVCACDFFSLISLIS
jgi:hypothetical protein